MAYLTVLRECARRLADRGRPGRLAAIPAGPDASPALPADTYLYRAWRRVVQNIPGQCSLCQCPAPGGRLCPQCETELVYSLLHTTTPRCAVCALALNPDGSCPDCQARRPAFDRLIAAFDYDNPGDLLIHRFKHDCFVDAPMLAGLLADAVRQAALPLPPATILVPVPSSRAAILRRGFNPAAEVARYLARDLGLACKPWLLRRSREGVRQAYLSKPERMRGAEHLYCCPVSVPQAAIAVVDDVITTGSTLHAIAGLFKRAGAASVYGLVLARTPRPPARTE